MYSSASFKGLPFQLVLMLLIVILAHIVTSQNSLTNNFKQTIHAATNEYIHSQEWTSYKASLGYSFPIPTCTLGAKDAVYPQVFNWTLSELVLCYEMETIEVWQKMHTKAGELLIKTLKNHYNIANLTATFLILNTTELGYFPTMKKAVDTSACHVAIASTNYDESRASEVDFQCPYGTSYTGVLRSELDNNTFIVTTPSDLNKEGVIIAAPYLTASYGYAKANFPKATILSNFGYTTAYQMVLNKEIHAIVGDYIEMSEWLRASKANCYNCYIKITGQEKIFGSFTAKFAVSSAMKQVVAFSHNNNTLLLFLMMILGFVMTI